MGECENHEQKLEKIYSNRFGNACRNYLLHGMERCFG